MAKTKEITEKPSEEKASNFLCPFKATTLNQTCTESCALYDAEYSSCSIKSGLFEISEITETLKLIRTELKG